MKNSGFPLPAAAVSPDDLSLRALRVIAAVASSGGVSRGATALGLAPSVISRQVALAERSLGGALFHRTGRGVQPTELGSRVLPLVDGLLAQADALARQSRELAGTPTGVVTVGLVPALAGPLASALHAAVRREHPQVRLRVLEGYSGDMETALSEGRVDLAVLNRYRSQGRNSYRKLFDTQLCIVARPLVLRRALDTGRGVMPARVNLAALARVPLVLPVAPNAIRNLLDEVAQRHQQPLKLLLEAGSSVIIRHMLRDHDCASVLPRHAVAPEVLSGELLALPLAERVFRQHVVLATSAQRPFSLASRAVAGLIPQVVDSLAELRV